MPAHHAPTGRGARRTSVAFSRTQLLEAQRRLELRLGIDVRPDPSRGGAPDADPARPRTTVLDEPLLTFPNITAIGIGHRSVRGRRLPQLCIAVFVRRKAAPRRVDPRFLIPPEIEGVPTDVIQELPPLGAMWWSGRENRRPHDPVPGGACIGIDDPDHGRCGTLTCAVWRGSNLAMLTANHVAACAGAQPVVGTGVVHPGEGARARVGVILDSLPFRYAPDRPACDSAPYNTADAAILDIIRPEIRVLGVGAPVGQPPHPLDIREGWTVVKSGRTSGVTRGRITHVNLSVKGVRYRDRYANLGGVFRVKACGWLGQFALPGDSGAAVFNHATNHPLGMITATRARERVAWVFPLHTAIGNLGVKIAGASGR